ncbi:MAG TPA: thioredoxin family protein [Chitinivibrionales bacterium]|jgi:thioredoxin 1|nr:thioredoxin family protein [Chitinivibrionales bacterium]
MTKLKKVSGTLLVVLSLTLPPLLFSCGRHAEVKSELPRISTIGEVATAMDSARDSLVVFEIYADWCAPCRALAPVLNKLAESYKGKVSFHSINVDQVPEAAQKFGVGSIPFVVFVKETTMVASLTGMQPEEEYVKIIRQYSTLSRVVEKK